jgi:hypothetical protein
MTIEKSPIQNPALDSIKQKFKIWRKTRTRGTRIPDELWQTTINIYHSQDLTLHKVARESMTSGKPGGLIVNRSKRSKNHEPPKGGQNNSN